jgi:hypothetical protein
MVVGAVVRIKAVVSRIVHEILGIAIAGGSGRVPKLTAPRV